jgi:nucleoside-triphosphatase THEP1
VSLLHPFQPFLYNAMTYSDVKTFAQQLYSDLNFHISGVRSCPKFSSEEELISNIVRALRKFDNKAKVIVIDEIDTFEGTHER